MKTINKSKSNPNKNNNKSREISRIREVLVKVEIKHLAQTENQIDKVEETR